MPDNHELDVATFSNKAALTDAANANGTQHTIASYAFVTDLTANGLKNAIHQNGVIVVGALINQNWWTNAAGLISWRKEDILPIRPPATHDRSVDTTLSGHCFVLYGYDEQYFYFVNSFGVEWADNGLGYFKVDELPFVYEAATVIDLTPAQIQALKDDIQAAQDALVTVDPTTIDGQRKLGFIAKIVEAIVAYFSHLSAGSGE